MKEGETTEAKLRCICGHRVACKVQSVGERIGFLAFFDDEPTSETHGWRVKSCPSCGEQLGLAPLYPKNRWG
jgi:hypothetical protein